MTPLTAVSLFMQTVLPAMAGVVLSVAGIVIGAVALLHWMRRAAR